MHTPMGIGEQKARTPSDYSVDKSRNVPPLTVAISKSRPIIGYDSTDGNALLRAVAIVLGLDGQVPVSVLGADCEWIYAFHTTPNLAARAAIRGCKIGTVK